LINIVKMDKEINFVIKKGVYCSWCADLMKRTLNQNFALKKVEIDLLKERVHIESGRKINPESIIEFLKKRGYYLIVEG